MLEFKERIITSLIFISVIFLLTIDIMDDLNAGSTAFHVIEESLILSLGIVGLFILWFKYSRSKKDKAKIYIDLTQARQDLEYFKKETRSLTEGFSLKIDNQLDAWKLTKAEKEVALLILKGLSNKEIALIRGTSEKTIRQQATSIYQKSNLSSRAELAAFFLEDLLVIPT